MYISFIYIFSHEISIFSPYNSLRPPHVYRASASIVRPIRRVGGPTVTPMPPGTVTSRDGKYQLQILAQPEQQHRARYQTEGSRGAVKDRSGNGFPIVKLIGYKKPAVLEVFIYFRWCFVCVF